jgi:hypothetical protein
VGGLESRISRLEGRMPDTVRDRQEDERLERERTITRMILDEFARLKASGETGDLLERSVRGVVEDQYSDLDQESRQYIADGWIETLRVWTRLDWMAKAGQPGAPSA